MKQFKPKMSGGSLSPEAHKEWADKGGKHVINGAEKKKAAPVMQSKKTAIPNENKQHAREKKADTNQATFKKMPTPPTRANKMKQPK